MNMGTAMINLIVISMICYIAWMLFRIILIPSDDIFLPALEPREATRTAWNNTLSYAIFGFAVCLAVLVVLYIAYKIISAIPLIGKIIIKKVPPFGALKSSGLIRLFDRLLGVIFSFDSIGKRFKRLGEALFGFMKDNGSFMKETISAIVHKSKLPDKEPPPSVPKPSKNELNANPDLTVNLSPSEQNIIQDKYQQCMEENIIPITKSMSGSDLTYAKQKNKATEALCQGSTGMTTVTNFTYTLPIR